MSYPVCVHSPNAEVARLASDWIAESRFLLPRQLALNIDVVASAVAAPNVPPVFRQGGVGIRGGNRGEPLTLDWSNGRGLAVLPAGALHADIVISREGLAHANHLLRSFLLNVCILLARRVGHHHVHAATLASPAGDPWMLVGVSRSGKSTTTAILGRSGWGIGTDDIAFLTDGTTAGTVDVVAWRERIALRNDVAERVGGSGGADLAGRGKVGWFPEELGSSWLSRVRPRVLGFPIADASRQTSVSRMGGAAALSRLMQCSPWVALEPSLSDEHLELMRRLVTQAEPWMMELGPDLFDRPSRLSELMV